MSRFARRWFMRLEAALLVWCIGTAVEATGGIPWVIVAAGALCVVELTIDCIDYARGMTR